MPRGLEGAMSQSGSSHTAVNAGVGMGSLLAGLISWSHTQSLGWTFLHAIFGWIYVIYALIVGKAHF